MEEAADEPRTRQIDQIDPQLMYDIELLLSRLVAKASQLIDNFTTNLVEGWMHVRTKFDGGKQINRSQSGSWQHRCMGAGLRHNEGLAWAPQTWGNVFNEPPNTVFVESAKKKAKEVETTRKRKATDSAKQARRVGKVRRLGNETTKARKAYARHDGGVGPNDIMDDLSSDQLQHMTNLFYRSNVVVSAEEARAVEIKTVTQSSSDLWREERRKRLTASNCGKIAKTTQKTVANKVKDLLYSTFKGNKATEWGKMQESHTRQAYVSYQNQHGHEGLTTSPTGLVIHPNHPWIACSPDDRVFDSNETEPNGLVEYKNSYSVRNMTLPEACQRSNFFLKRTEDGSLSLKTTHDYYHQVQCQLFVDGKSWCDFVVQTNIDLFVQRIYRDKDFWGKHFPKLERFYFKALLPELAVPMYHCGGIRPPQSVI